MNKALIIGHTGQDGYYLTKILEENNFKVFGVSTNECYGFDKNLDNIDITNEGDVNKLIELTAPTQVYYLAAYHHSSTDKFGDSLSLMKNSIAVNVTAPLYFLNAVFEQNLKSKFFYAASSHIFGKAESSPQNENTLIDPFCAYGITKVAGINFCNIFSKQKGVATSVGIFYNHESPIRKDHFVSRKIVKAAVQIKKGKQDKLTLGDLESKVDWGFAGDYMEAVYLMMQESTSNMYVIGSGKTHTIKDFVQKTFDYLNLDWRKHVDIDPSLISKGGRGLLQSDINKIKKDLGWEPRTTFEELVEMMIKAEMNN